MVNATRHDPYSIQLPPQLVFTVLLVGLAIVVLFVLIVLLLKARCADRRETASADGDSTATERVECSVYLVNREPARLESKETQTDASSVDGGEEDGLYCIRYRDEAEDGLYCIRYRDPEPRREAEDESHVYESIA